MTSFPWSRINTGLLLLVLLAIIGVFASRAYGGPLDPPGSPAPTESNVIFQPASCAGFPIVISSSGSYRLGGNIAGCAGKDGIQVTADDVSLDLAGFTVRGVGTFNNGIVGSNPRLTLTNGDIIGWTFGADLSNSADARIEHLIVSSNVSVGLILGAGDVVSDVTITGNGAGVFSQVNGVHISGCSVLNNTGTGIGLYGDGSTVERCEIGNNGQSGITGSGQRARIVDNHVYGNGLYGIQFSGNCAIENNDVENNVSSSGAGISTSTGSCTIVGNTARGNYSGILVGGTSGRVDSNHMDHNAQYGLVVSAVSVFDGNMVIRNSASNNPIGNYNIGGGNDAGPIAPAGTTTNPWANISN